MSLLNLDLSTDHKTSALGPLLARGPPVAHCCFRVLHNAQKLFVVLSFSFHLKRSSSWCCRGKAKDAARSCGGGELPRLVFFFSNALLVLQSELTSDNSIASRGLTSPGILTSPFSVTGSLTERLKLIGRVRKKARVGDAIAAAPAVADDDRDAKRKQQSDLRQTDFRATSRLLK